MNDEDFDSLELRLMKEFLEDASANDWLVTALTMNYDGKSPLIQWMASHPHLDRGTAKALFWHSSPGYYQKFANEDEVPSVNQAGWIIVHSLMKRFLGGDFRNGSAFDPSSDLSNPTGNPKRPGYDWTAEALTASDSPAWLIPDELFAPAAGDELDVVGYVETNGWDEGMPPSVLKVLELAYEDYEEND